MAGVASTSGGHSSGGGGGGGRISLRRIKEREKRAASYHDQQAILTEKSLHLQKLIDVSFKKIDELKVLIDQESTIIGRDLTEEVMGPALFRQEEVTFKALRYLERLQNVFENGGDIVNNSQNHSQNSKSISYNHKNDNEKASTSSKSNFSRENSTSSTKGPGVIINNNKHLSKELSRVYAEKESWYGSLDRNMTKKKKRGMIDQKRYIGSMAALDIDQAHQHHQQYQQQQQHQVVVGSKNNQSFAGDLNLKPDEQYEVGLPSLTEFRAGLPYQKRLDMLIKYPQHVPVPIMKIPNTNHQFYQYQHQQQQNINLDISHTLHSNPTSSTSLNPSLNHYYGQQQQPEPSTSSSVYKSNQQQQQQQYQHQTRDLRGQQQQQHQQHHSLIGVGDDLSLNSIHNHNIMYQQQQQQQHHQLINESTLSAQNSTSSINDFKRFQPNLNSTHIRSSSYIDTTTPMIMNSTISTTNNNTNISEVFSPPLPNLPLDSYPSKVPIPETSLTISSGFEEVESYMQGADSSRDNKDTSNNSSESKISFSNESTKPFEMSDYYKYSLKFRKQKSASISPETMENPPSISSISPEFYPLVNQPPPLPLPLPLPPPNSSASFGLENLQIMHHSSSNTSSTNVFQNTNHPNIFNNQQQQQAIPIPPKPSSSSFSHSNHLLLNQNDIINGNHNQTTNFNTSHNNHSNSAQQRQRQQDNNSPPELPPKHNRNRLLNSQHHQNQNQTSVHQYQHQQQQSMTIISSPTSTSDNSNGAWIMDSSTIV